MSLPTIYCGLRVLDLSTNLAGPFAAMILGDLGADVVKVERPPAGDDTRSLPPHRDGEATVFQSVNRNKRSLLLDLRAEDGRAALLRLVAKSDVVVESFGPGIAERLSLTYDHLRAVNPRVVACSVSAFGEGPLGSRAGGYDALVQAVSGMMSFTGHPDMPPLRIAPSVVDLSTGMWAAIGIMAALAEPPDQRGALVQPTLMDSAFTLMCHQILGFLATGEEPRKLGSGAPSATPYRVFEASDGAIMVATATDAQFARLCEVLGMPQLADDPRFATARARVTARDDLDELIAAAIARDTVDEWLRRLAHARISAGRVNGLGEALASPLGAEREIVVQPRAGRPPQLRLPIDRAGACVRLPPPRLGEHSAEVLRETGFTETEIEALQSTVRPPSTTSVSPVT
jgi:crotonobetainyl-CoA:carnitine CoA-transferase CaiB-like acyl-CoA transferase